MCRITQQVRLKRRQNIENKSNVFPGVLFCRAGLEHMQISYQTQSMYDLAAQNKTASNKIGIYLKIKTHRTVPELTYSTAPTLPSIGLPQN